MRLNINLFSSYLLILLFFVVAAKQEQNVISRRGGNILRNLTRMHAFEAQIVTSQLDSSLTVRMLYRGLREIYSRLIAETGKSRDGNRVQQIIPESVPFPCATKGYRSTNTPNSVHQLRPGDIDIVAAIGDSLTSATSANAIRPWELLAENRGLAWCIGGQGNWKTHLTLPNILKEFNPKLFGFSLSDAYNVHRSAQFNVAENIATTSDMPYNAEKLVNRMRLDSRVNMKQHWKLLTFMIGGNDFCSDICYQSNATEWMNESQEKSLIKTLLYLRKNMPRTLVNLVPSPLINMALSMDGLPKPWLCSMVQPIECSCFFGPAYSKAKAVFRNMERNFVKLMEKISFLEELHTNDFTVVYQPFFKEASVYLGSRSPDMSIVAIDCVHFSQKGHAISANSLWNNMLEPVGEKSLGLKPLFQEFKCPTQLNPYIFTNFNSQF